jgi:ParB family chromosome partitioning protein
MSKLTYEIVMNAVGWFTILDQIRKQVDAAEDERLAESVRQHGILSPLGARHDGRLVWGHRRLRAAIAAGLAEVPTVLLDKDMTEGEYLQLQVQENNARLALSGWEQWHAAEALLRAYPDWMNADLARAMSVDASMVPRLLAARKLIPDAQEALRGRSASPRCTTSPGPRPPTSRPCWRVRGTA